MKEVPILLADDHRLVLDGIASMLQHSPYRIADMFTDGDSAAKWLKENRDKVELVITDISMPGMNGIELCRFIKKNFNGLPVLILSMYNSAAATEEALDAEADGFILKNAGMEEFIKALDRLTNGSTYFSEEIVPLLRRQIAREKKRSEESELLTPREKEILELIAQEFTSDAIASKLFISKKTVDNHRTNMLQKTGSQSTIGLVKFAIRNGIINP